MTVKCRSAHPNQRGGAKHGGVCVYHTKMSHSGWTAQARGSIWSKWPCLFRSTHFLFLLFICLLFIYFSQKQKILQILCSSSSPICNALHQRKLQQRGASCASGRVYVVPPSKMATTTCSDKRLVRSKSGLKIISLSEGTSSPLTLDEPQWSPDSEVGVRDADSFYFAEADLNANVNTE